MSSPPPKNFPLMKTRGTERAPVRDCKRRCVIEWSANEKTHSEVVLDFIAIFALVDLDPLKSIRLDVDRFEGGSSLVAVRAVGLAEDDNLRGLEEAVDE